MMVDFPCLVENPVRHLIEGRPPEDGQSFAGVQRLWVAINQASQLAFTQESEHRSICCRRTTEPTGLSGFDNPLYPIQRVILTGRYNHCSGLEREPDWRAIIAKDACCGDTREIPLVCRSRPFSQR